MRKVSLLPFFFSFALSLHVSLSRFCLPSVAAGVRASLWLHPLWLHQRYHRGTHRQTNRQTDRGRESGRIRKVRVNGWWREVKKEAQARQMSPVCGESVLTNRGGGGAGFPHINSLSGTDWTFQQLNTPNHWLLLTNHHYSVFRLSDLVEPQCISYNLVAPVEMLISIPSIPLVVLSKPFSVILVDLDKLCVVEVSYQ